MADIRCPMCGKPNPTDLEECQFCGARIKPMLASTPVDSKPIQAGEKPIVRDTSEFEKVKPSDEGPIHPGEAPTPKDTGELERALPSWLRSLRKGEEISPDEETPVGAFLDAEQPESTEGEESTDGVSDWLAGLGKAAGEDDEDVPDWLSGLRGDQPAPIEQESIPESNIPSDDADWMKALGSELRSGAFTQDETPLAVDIPPAQTASSEELPDWLQGLQGDSSKEPETPAPVGDGDLSTWLSGLPEEPAGAESPQIPAATSSDEGDLPAWLSGLPGEPVSQQPEQTPAATQGEEIPNWLGQFDEKNAEPEPTAESVPDWLTDLPGANVANESSVDAVSEEDEPSGEEVPDWLDQFKQDTGESKPAFRPSTGALTGFETEPGAPASAQGESVPEWLSNLEETAGPGVGTPAAVFGGEISDGSALPGETPDWLSQLQSDISATQEAEEPKDEFEVVESSEKKDEGPLPDWLAGIEPASSAVGSAPALIIGEEDNVTGQEGESAFTMETPDWLSGLKPEERTEKKGENVEETSAEDLEAAELPSWVQAMRPVEAVVSAEPKSAPVDEGGKQVEQSGPLAGLQGVLPAAPGLGMLRKPPAYSIKLQVTENQKKYAAYLERLVKQEAQAKGPGAARLESSRVWRWAIFFLLLIVVLVSLSTDIISVPGSALQPREMQAAYNMIEQTGPGSAVLVVFDYDPALFGEMEAAAAPLVGHLLSKNPRLAFISTSPTGPALAERFMLETQGEQYRAGEQYVDLGYLAGGPSGVLGFASSPRTTAGTSAEWESAPLAGVNTLSDFGLILILTDNADTGRVWIEQARGAIDNDTPLDYSDDTPILMAISAQAEPMLIPYYDSGQVQGVVTGLVGGKTYEQARNSPAKANEYWNAFSFVTFMAELLIIGGAIWGAITNWRARKTKSGEEA